MAVRLGRALAFSFLHDIRRGRLLLSLPDGSTQSFGDTAADQVALRVNDDRFFLRVLLAGDREIGESWARGEWDTDNLPGVLSLFASNGPDLAWTKLLPSRTARGARLLANRAARFARRGGGPATMDLRSFRLTPDILATFLGPALSLAAARFTDPAMTLAQAREVSLSRILAKVRLRPGHHLLVVGDPRGGIALESARLAGCRVTLLTGHPRAEREAKERARAAGLSETVAVMSGDLAGIGGSFDRVVALEEAPPAAPGALFRHLDRLLTRRGIAVARLLAAPSATRRACRRGGSWLRRRGFPGGDLPVLERALRASLAMRRLTLEGMENLAPHAARTLAELRMALSAGRERALALGADESALREWAFFFALGEAAFSLRLVADLELTLSRPGNPDLPSPPRRQF